MELLNLSNKSLTSMKSFWLRDVQVGHNTGNDFSHRQEELHGHASQKGSGEAPVIASSHFIRRPNQKAV